jgi:serine/threonine protein kinase
VAIKSIRKDKIKDEQDLLHIRREIEIMSSLNHPHIIAIHEGTVGGLWSWQLCVCVCVFVLATQRKK